MTPGFDCMDVRGDRRDRTSAGQARTGAVTAECAAAGAR